MTTRNIFVFVLFLVGSQAQADAARATKRCPLGPVGGIVLKVTDSAGAPYDGLSVRLDGTKRRLTTDARGLVHFKKVPAGPASLSYEQPFVTTDGHGNQIPARMRLENAVLVMVKRGETVQLSSQVEAQADVLVAPRQCGTTPWAIVGITEGGLAPFVAKGSVGKVGPCACQGFADDPLGDPACPGTTVYGASAAPPAQLWSVISETCLGDVPACPLPIEAIQASVFK